MQFKKCIPFIFLLLVGCSLYESSGREAIEKNQSNVVGSFGTFDKERVHYTSCATSLELPDFLKEPLEVIATPYEYEDILALYSDSSSPRWIVVHRFNSSENRHDFCKVYSLNGLSARRSKLTSAIRIGVSHLKNL